MRCSPLAPLLLVPLALAALRGAESNPLAASAPPAATPATPAAPVAPRAVSPETAALLAASLPKIALANPEGKKPAAPPTDLRETDKPANTIVRLPKYLVREPRPPVFREQDLYTQDDLGRRLAKRYYPEWFRAFNRLARFTPLVLFIASAEDSALMQFEEDERLRNMADVADQTNMLMRSNPAAAKKWKSDAQEFFMHWSDLGWSSSANR